MSFEINWEKLQDDDGAQLSETIRAFLDQRFKEMTLPSYLKSISVTSFDLGNIAPDIEIRRITDPFPEFYMDDEDDDAGGPGTNGDVRGMTNLSADARSARRDETDSRSTAGSTVSEPPAYETDESVTDYNNTSDSIRPGDNQGSLSFNNNFNNTSLYTPSIASSIPASNLHFPSSIQSNFISGIRSPFYPQWQNSQSLHVPPMFPVMSLTGASETSSDIGENDTTRASSPSLNPSPSLNNPDRDNDIQLYLQISYKGDIKVGIETTLLLNYPSPNFVSLPLKLTITGLEISSIAALAYIDRRIHFSFICDVDANGNAVTLSGHDRVEIIKDIKIESEIGDQEGNGPVLRNVGKIERFLLDRLRHLARDELAWPGWITVEI